MRISLPLSGTVLVVCLFASVTMASTQVPTGVVDGQAVDPDGRPLPGASVEITGPSLMGSRIAFTGATGSFRFPAVPRGEEYVLTFSLSGFKTIVRRDIIVRLNMTTTIDVSMDLTGVEETITVTGESPVIDVRSTNVGVNIGSQGRSRGSGRLPQHRHSFRQQHVSRLAGLLLAGPRPAGQQHRR